MILEKIFRAETISTSEQLDALIRSGLSSQSATGLNVTPETAMGVPTVYGCVRVLAETLAQVPLDLYRNTGDGGKKKAKDHPLYRVLHSSPNDWQTSFEWRELMQGHISLRGNGYNFINRLRSGEVRELLPIHPDRVKSEQQDNYKIKYTISMGDGEREFNQNQILHLRGLSSNGVNGLSPITLLRETVGVALAAERHGAKLFGNGTTLSGVLKHPQSLSDPAFERLKASLKEEHSGVDNAFKNLILEEGMTWESVGMTNKDTQFVELGNFKVEDIARAYRVPTVLLQHADKSSTYASAEQFFLSFVKFTMMPWYVRWEQTLSKSLLSKEEQGEYFFRFNPEGLLRGDSAARAAYYASGITNGWLVRNQARTMEDMNPIDGLDEPLQPLNMGNPNEV